MIDIIVTTYLLGRCLCVSIDLKHSNRRILIIYLFDTVDDSLVFGDLWGTFVFVIDLTLSFLDLFRITVLDDAPVSVSCIRVIGLSTGCVHPYSNLPTTGFE
jgi:hypothetical protein